MPSIVVDTQTRSANLNNGNWTQLGEAYTVSPEDCVVKLTMNFTAKRSDNGDTALWSLMGTWKRHNGGDLQPVGGGLASLLSGIANGKQGDLGAALWDVKVEEDGNELTFHTKAHSDVYAAVKAEIEYTLPDSE